MLVARTHEAIRRSNDHRFDAGPPRCSRETHRGARPPDLSDRPGALFAVLEAHAPSEGLNPVTAWPGLAVRRLSGPAHLRFTEFASLTLVLVVPADGAASYVGGRRISGAASYVVIGAGASIDLRITAASKHRPILFCALHIDPHLVRAMSSSIDRYGLGTGLPTPTGALTVSAVGVELMCSVAGFLTALSSVRDRGVLAPLRMQEVVYRLLLHEQRTKLRELVAAEIRCEPVAAALDHIANHLAEPLTVESLAVRVSLSPSAFSHAFREATGQPPHRYIKERRLDRAGELLAEQRLGVSAVAGAVGYCSVSHFIKEFRGRFGSTPGQYAGTVRHHRKTVGTALQ